MSDSADWSLVGRSTAEGLKRPRGKTDCTSSLSADLSIEPKSPGVPDDNLRPWGCGSYESTLLTQAARRNGRSHLGMRQATVFCQGEGRMEEDEKG